MSKKRKKNGLKLSYLLVPVYISCLKNILLKQKMKSKNQIFPEIILDPLASLQVRLREFFQDVKKNYVVVDNIILNNVY